MSKVKLSKVLEITKLAMEINELGKHQVFVRISPHVKVIDISVIEGEWEKGKEDVFQGHFYYAGVNCHISDYNFIKNKLLEIKQKDLSGVESFKVAEINIQDNYSTNNNKVKQVRLISQEDYLDLIAFLSDMEMAIGNNDIDLALIRLKDQKKMLKEKIGES